MEHIYEQDQFGENWFTYPELYREFVAILPQDSTFVEVGSWKGKSTAFLGVEIINSKKNVKCYAIDTWQGSSEHQNDEIIKTDKLYELFLSNIDPIKNAITPIRKASVEASEDFEDESIDICFIDAAHEYERVKEDIYAWLPKIKSGGYITGHDYLLPSVKRAVDEIFGENVLCRSAMENCWIVRVESEEQND